MIKILLLSLFVCLTFCFGACTKRDKLTDNTMILQIEQLDVDSDVGKMNVGNDYRLKAVIRNVKLEEIDEPVSWSVSPSDLGSFSGNTTITSFTPKKASSGKISLTCQGMSASLDVTVS